MGFGTTGYALRVMRFGSCGFQPHLTPKVLIIRDWKSQDPILPRLEITGPYSSAIGNHRTLFFRDWKSQDPILPRLEIAGPSSCGSGHAVSNRI